MKKKSLSLVTLTLALVLSGCGLNSTTNTEDISSIEMSAAESQDSDQKSTDESASESSVGQESSLEEKINGSYMEELAMKVGRDSVSGIVFSFDENGNKVGEYDLAGLEQKLKESEYELDTYSFVTSYKGILYFQKLDYGTNDYRYQLIAYDPEKDIFALVMQTEYGEFIPSIDIYKGRIYVLMSKEVEGKFSWRLKCYEKDADGLSFSEKETEHADVYEYFSDYNLNYVERLCRKNDGPERILDETGFLIGRKDEAYYILYPDKTTKKIESIEFNNGGIKGFDDKKIICTKYKDNYDFMTSGYEVIDLDTMKAKELELPDDAVCLYYKNGKLLYYVKDGTEYGKENITLYSLDMENNETTELIERAVVPGMHYFSPIIENFELFEDRVFFTDVINGEIKVFEAKLYNNEFLPENLGCGIEKNDLYDLGTVESISVTRDCPFCGKHISQAYAEYMVFDKDKVRNADKINEQLKQYAEAAVSYYENYDGDGLIYENSCGHEEDYFYTVTDDENIGSVIVLEDRYVAVNMEGYWYGGGAHGMPSRDQYLFDMTTGDAVSFKDLYTGTEDQLKEIVATKVKEDYESYTGDDYPPYFMANAQEAYDTAYEYANIDGCISFSEDGVIYTFYPYDLASYADGFKNYVISYDEIFGRKTLTP